MLKKSTNSGSNPYLALLEMRNTPIEENMGSPAQLLMGRRLKSKLPASSDLLKPSHVTNTDVKDKLKFRQERQKFYHDRGAVELPPIEVDDQVRIRRGAKWQPAVVIGEHNPNSFTVETPDSGQYRRNRQHLLKTNERSRSQHPVRPDPVRGENQSVYGHVLSYKKLPV